MQPKSLSQNKTEKILAPKKNLSYTNIFYIHTLMHNGY